MNLYTIGFTQKSAQHFFKLIKDNKIELLLDIRLNNSSQLAGFTKGNDLKYFLEELCNCKYKHSLEFAPTEAILSAYKEKEINWESYVEAYIALIKSRNVVVKFDEMFTKYNSICLLCSEPTYEYCHRGVLANMIVSTYPQIELKHLV